MRSNIRSFVYKSRPLIILGGRLLLLGVLDASAETRLLTSSGVVLDDTTLGCLVDCLVGLWKKFLGLSDISGCNCLDDVFADILHRGLAAKVKDLLALAAS